MKSNGAQSRDWKRENRNGIHNVMGCGSAQTLGDERAGEGKHVLLEVQEGQKNLLWQIGQVSDAQPRAVTPLCWGLPAHASVQTQTEFNRITGEFIRDDGWSPLSHSRSAALAQ